MLSHYVDVGVGELDREKLAPLLRLKYGPAILDAVRVVGPDIGGDFRDFQRHLYEDRESA